MKQILLAIIFSQITSVSFSQLTKSKTKYVDLKKTKYEISLPKDLKLQPRKGVDYLYYSISKKDGNTKPKFEGGIYLGYFPGTLVAGNYSIIDSTNRKMLNDTIYFKIRIR